MRGIEGIFLFLLLGMAGCTQYVPPPSSIGTTPPPSGSLSSKPVGSRSVGSSGSTHRVERGETLWRIAHRYGIEVEELARVNRISDASQIEVGQKLVIPERRLRRTAVSSPAAAPPSTGSVSFRQSSAEEFIWPVQGKVIWAFGMRRFGSVNKGIDIQAPLGSEIRAVKSGQVSFVHEEMPGFGKTIIVEHGEGFATVYAYIGEILVQAGQTISQRQIIARVGKSGRLMVPALHFEIRRNQKPGNPLYYLP